MTLNITVVAPIPSASAKTAISAKRRSLARLPERVLKIAKKVLHVALTAPRGSLASPVPVRRRPVAAWRRASSRFIPEAT